MKTLRLLFIISLFSNGVFGDTGEVKTVSVMEGDSLTLHIDTHIQTDDVMEWMFGDEEDLIAKLDKEQNKILSYIIPDGTFTGRLKLNNQTGDLTITNIRSEDTGVYKVKISAAVITIRAFSVTVFGAENEGMKTVSVMEGDPVTLHTNVPDIKKDYVIRWMFQDGNSLLAEINRKTGIISIYNDVLDGRFRDRLQLDQTGSLTIRNIRANHSGLYEVDISSSTHTIHQSLTVTVRGEVKTVSVMEGDSLTLHTDVTEIQTYDLIQWRFGPDDTRIAEIYKPDSLFSTNDVADGRFRGRLQVDDQTGSLTITNIRTEDSGVYELKISSSRRSIHMKFIVTVSGAGVSRGESSGVSSGVTAGVCVSLLLLVIAAAVAGVIYYRRRLSKDTRKVITVNEEQSHTLHTHVTEIQTDDVIEWRFGDQETLIAKIHKKNDISRTYDGDEDLFKNTLELKDQTGDLTIKNITNKHSGVYTLKIITGEETSYRRFQLTVTDSNRGANSEEMNMPLIK